MVMQNTSFFWSTYLCDVTLFLIPRKNLGPNIPRLSAMSQRYMEASKFVGVDIHDIFEVLESDVNSIST